MGARLLLIEDEVKIARVIQLELIHEGYEVTCQTNGKEGLSSALEGEWDLILLDLMLPGLNGWEVLKSIRVSGVKTPVIILTAKDQVEDKVSGLDLGANDYVTKPFSIEELLARIRNMLRLFQAANEDFDTFELYDLAIHTKARQVYRNNKLIELTPREFDLLLYMVKHKEQVLSRDELLSEVWGFDFAGQTNLVDVYIRYLRQKIDKGFPKKLIQTVRGIGYCIREPEQ
jgi:DNA-binding response OmpR family regulator